VSPEMVLYIDSVLQPALLQKPLKGDDAL